MVTDSREYLTQHSTKYNIQTMGTKWAIKSDWGWMGAYRLSTAYPKYQRLELTDRAEAIESLKSLRQNIKINKLSIKYKLVRIVPKRPVTVIEGGVGDVYARINRWLVAHYGQGVRVTLQAVSGAPAAPKPSEPATAPANGCFKVGDRVSYEGHKGTVVSLDKNDWPKIKWDTHLNEQCHWNPLFLERVR